MWIATFLLALPVAGVADQFDEHWHDGKAELDGYRLEVSRYGQNRRGTAVLVYVTEPFSRSKLVKVDDHTRNPDDVVDVLKLNLVRDFQTGVYDYNTMTSAFARTSDFTPVKVSFSSAEWCGHVYSELEYRDAIQGFYASYFEDESGRVELERKKGGVTGDNLFILLRGLRGEYLAPGASKKVPYLPSAYHSRLSHKAIRWTSATISRAREPETTAVPAGAFETTRYDVVVDDGRKGSFWIETAYPHRIVRWIFSPDILAELTGSARLAYWRLNRNGDERYLEQIGVAPLEP
jgi:hypothetical protein